MLRQIISSVFLLLLCSFVSFSQTRQVAVTFDDLPATLRNENYRSFEYVTKELLAKLKSEKIPAIGFVNERKLFAYGEIDKRTELLKMWLDNGHELGNHTFSHIAINSNSFEDYTADLLRGETVTRMLLKEQGKRLKFYRHTQLRTGPTEEYRLRLKKFLDEHGYTVAPVTIDNNDYIYSAVYSAAKLENDRELQTKIVDSYIEYMESVFAHFEKLSRDFLGREVSQTLLLHANEINADHFDKLARMMRDRGYEFITLDEALKDDAYQMTEVQSTRGLSWIHRWMLAKGLKIKEEPVQPAFIDELFRKYQRQS
ncbi:MAG: polysaccharide deacetylase family protein [Pyrinomonadaceae bacterium]